MMASTSDGSAAFLQRYRNTVAGGDNAASVQRAGAPARGAFSTGIKGAALTDKYGNLI